jgi:peptide/nickel transport system ATP-binding protein
MYAGRKVEEADVRALFKEPLHPYTVGLLRSMPSVERARVDGRRPRLAEIPGMVPLLHTLPSGCRFADRCPVATGECRQEDPPMREHRPNHWAACWHTDRAMGCFDA